VNDFGDQKMTRIRFASSIAIAYGVLFLCVTPLVCNAQSSAPASMEMPKVFSPAPAKASASFPTDDFLGLEYTAEQKVEIDRIQKNTKAQVELIAKDQKLSADQKDAMMLGYSRMEYGRIYTVLTPVQRRQVQQRLRARRVADEATKKNQAPNN
jgi:hypothetical protein